MPRKPRRTDAGVYHVTARAVPGHRLFGDDHDFLRFESELRRIVTPECTCVAACALNTHYHLLLHVEANVLHRALHLLNSRYAAAYKARYARTGHTFGERYTSVFVESDEHLVTVFRYIARNPVEAGLCARPEDWPWSSYRAAIGLPDGRFTVADPSLVLACFDGSVEGLRAFVETPWASDRTAGPGPAARGLAP
jgi:REP-associated tyrosine transposase